MYFWRLPCSCIYLCDFELLRFIILMYAQSCVLKMGNISLLILCMFIILLLNVFGLLVYFLIIIGWCMLEIWLDFLIGCFMRGSLDGLRYECMTLIRTQKKACVYAWEFVSNCSASYMTVRFFYVHFSLRESCETFFLYSLAISCFASCVEYGFVSVQINDSDHCLENCWCIWSPCPAPSFTQLLYKGKKNNIW